ncbi:MAG TPA: ATP-binding protein [Candidatus Limnocylindrales bacterium]|nr:ATP-binding protein [Candidatus Limnocylindrales bacterium]
MHLDRIAVRIALAALFVAGLVLAIVAIGVMRVGSDAFATLMAAAGVSAEHAHEMFDSSVALVLWLAAAAGTLAGIVAAIVLARRIARPIESLAATAGRTATGDLEARVPEDGPSELRELAAAYNLLVDRLAEQESIRREFIVNASHELRTPLTNLQGYLEALRDGVIAPDPATFDSLREEVDRLSRLAASLDLLVGTAGERQTPGRLDLAAAVRTSVELATPGFARRSISVTTTVEDEVSVIARADEIAQVLANLLQNANRYTPVGGSVEVAIGVTPTREARVRITNSGPGIPEAELPRVWERFYRVEKSRTRATGGAGIGLAIVKRIVEDAGGRVGASSSVGETTFWFSLPAGAG